MFEKIVLALARKIVQKQQKKMTDQKISADEKVRREAYNELKQLYSFVQFLNQKVFRNRHERKTFWRNVQDGQPALENTIQKIMSNYLKEKAVVKPSAVEATIPAKKEDVK